MNKSSGQAPHPKDIQLTNKHENMINILCYQGIANQNNNGILLHTYLEWPYTPI